jgi:hypothetical protein
MLGIASPIRRAEALTRVVGTVNRAVLGASQAIRTVFGIPRVAVEAVGVSTGDMGPSPVRVEHN